MTLVSALDVYLLYGEIQTHLIRLFSLNFPLSQEIYFTGLFHLYSHLHLCLNVCSCMCVWHMCPY